MKFRPCIDLLGGKVRQIVGSSLNGPEAVENYVSPYGAEHYARMYRDDGLDGGHVIILDRPGTEGAAADLRQALEAFGAFPGGLQAGGGISPQNASLFLEAGASHVIVTSYVFENGTFSPRRLKEISAAVGKERLVLDFSCKKKEDGRYYAAVNRWRDLTDLEVCPRMFSELSLYCAEFLVHAIEVEGKKNGIDEALIALLARSPVPVTYAGGIGGLPDILRIGELAEERVDFTVGSALDLFGGGISYRELVRLTKNNLWRHP